MVLPSRHRESLRHDEDDLSMSHGMSFRLDDKVAIVTGGSSGLGVAFAVGLAEAGADVVICARRADRLAKTARAVEKLGRRTLAVECDVTDPDACGRVVDRAIEAFGSVDIL